MDSADPTPSVSVALLGVPRLILHREKPHPLERRDAALLALLAVDGPTPRHRVVALLWPDLPTRTAQTNLRQRLFRLKQRAGREIVVSGPVMALAEGVRHDLDARSHDTLDDSQPIAAPTLLGGLEYADNEALAEWVTGARQRWDGDLRKQLAQRASQLEAQGRIADALVHAERLVQEVPTAEHAHRRLMRLHYRRGDRGAALAAFERCSEALERELGTAPGTETIELAALIKRSGALPPPVAAPNPVAVLRPPRLVGRNAEWHSLEIAWSLQQPILIRGEPGIGKSRLATDFSAAQQQSNVYRAHPGDARQPYTLLVRMLRELMRAFATAPGVATVTELSRLLPELGAPPPGPLEPLALRRAFGEVIAHWQSHGLTALVIDDLQFADTASLDLLLGWLPQPGRPQLVMTVRAAEIPAALAEWLRAPGLTVREIALGPLDRAGIVALLDSLAIPLLDSAAWVEPLARHTGGNPLFILETLVAALAAGPIDANAASTKFVAPGHLGRLLERRLAQLPPEALRLARVAALAGPDFSAELAARVLQTHVLDLSDAWFALEEAQVIRDGSFAHDLILEATLRSVPRSIAVALHRSVANALEAATHAPARIAHHWQMAAEWSRAAPLLERAALAAQVASRPVEALAAWEAAASCHRAGALPGSGAAALECDWQVVRKLVSTGKLGIALDRANAMLSAANDQRQLAVALVARAQVQVESGDAEVALADARRAGELAQGADDARLALLATHQAASALMRLGRATEAIVLREGHTHEMHMLDDEERLDWLDIYATALDYADRRSEALQVFDTTITQAEQLGRWDLANSLGNNRAIALMYLNRLQACTQAVRIAIEHGRRAGIAPAGLVLEEMMLAGNLRDLGQFAEFLQIAEPLPQGLRDAGYSAWACNAENDLAGGYAWLGRQDLALKTLSPMTDDMAPAVRAMRLFTRARLLRARPDAPVGESPGQMVRRAQALIESAGGTGRSYVRLKVALELARDLDPAEAIAQVAAIEAEAKEREQFMLALHALQLRTELLLRSGAPARAADAARELVARCEREGTPAGLYAPEIWWTAHQALLDVDARAAEACLRTAVQWIERAARQHVPAMFQQSFLARNPVNAAVRAAAARWR
ncbi:MAG: BTAD domain-containing putative transcriptional regulator [Burkholderiales bacterium]